MVLAVVKCILTVQCIALNGFDHIKHSVFAKSMKYLQNTLSATFSVYILFRLTPFFFHIKTVNDVGQSIKSTASPLALIYFTDFSKLKIFIEESFSQFSL